MGQENSITKISIIIPCYNYSHFLPQALQSVINQSFKDWECIIVNDGSTDDTQLVAEKYSILDSRIKVYNTFKRGVSSARNLGISLSNGEFIQFLDADDLIEASKLEFHLRLFENDPSIDIVFGTTRYFISENPSIKMLSMSRSNQGFMPTITGVQNSIIKDLIKGNVIPINSALLRKNVINSVGLFDINKRYLEDWEFWFNCAIENKKFYFLDMEGTYALVRSHLNSASRDEWNMVMAEFQLRDYFNTRITNELKDYNELQRKETSIRLVHVVIVDLLKFQFKQAYYRLTLITKESNIFKILLFLYKKGLYPNFTVKRLFHYSKKMFSVK